MVFKPETPDAGDQKKSHTDVADIGKHLLKDVLKDAENLVKGTENIVSKAFHPHQPAEHDLKGGLTCDSPYAKTAEKIDNVQAKSEKSAERSMDGPNGSKLDVDEHGRITCIRYKNGDYAQLSYDDQGNVIEMRRHNHDGSQATYIKQNGDNWVKYTDDQNGEHREEIHNCKLTIGNDKGYAGYGDIYIGYADKNGNHHEEKDSSNGSRHTKDDEVRDLSGTGEKAPVHAGIAEETKDTGESRALSPDEQKKVAEKAAEVERILRGLTPSPEALREALKGLSPEEVKAIIAKVNKDIPFCGLEAHKDGKIYYPSQLGMGGTPVYP